MNLEIFLSLSRVLTGKDALDSTRAAALRRRLDTHFASNLAELGAAFEMQLKKTKTPTEALQATLAGVGTADQIVTQRHAVCRAIVWIWYTGQFFTPYELPDGPQTPEQYADGLLWEVIRAHPPGFHPGGFGAWARLPETPDGSDRRRSSHD